MYINKFFKCIAIVAMLTTVATTVSAQEPTKQDYKVAKKEAKDKKKEGWKVHPGNLSIEEQIAYSKPILRNQEEWATDEASSMGTVYDVVRSNALFQAKVNLASKVFEILWREARGSGGNIQKIIKDNESSTEFMESSKARFINEIQRPRILMDCYRNIGNGTVEVLIRMALRWENARSSFEEMAEKWEQMNE